MTGTISDALRVAGREIASVQAHDIAARLNAALGSILTGFYVGPGTMIDKDGAKSAPFGSLISLEPPQADGTVRADAVACAIYACETLDLASLTDGYARFAEVRRLQKTPSTIDARSTVTLALIVAANSVLSLDDLAAEMRKLNKTVADGERPDMVAVMTRGTINYGVSFPGDESISDFLPPAPGGSVALPVNLQQVVTDTTTHALNRVCGFLIGQMAFYAPEAARPDMRAATDGCLNDRRIVWAYRYESSGRVSDAAKVQASAAPAYRIEDPQGTLLSRLTFQPWQDGGIVVSEGPLPLEGLLPLSGQGLPTMTFRMKSDHQISCVLSLNDRGFVELMTRLGKKMGGVTIRQEPPQYTIAHFLNEGTSSPFAARLCMTPLTMRNLALTNTADVARFDELYQFVMNHLVDIRKTAVAMLEMWCTYAARVEAGELVRYDNAIHVDEPIDQLLNKQIASFVMDAARVSKEFQKLTRVLGVEIRFLFQQDAAFNKGITALASADPALADYLRESRKWLEPLRLFRDEIEHENYVAPRIGHDRAQDGRITAREPRLLGLPLTQVVPYLENRLNRFVEELLMWSIANSLPAPMIVTEIPLAARDPNKVERFKVVLAGSAPEWQLTHSAAAFNDV